MNYADFDGLEVYVGKPKEDGTLEVIFSDSYESIDMIISLGTLLDLSIFLRKHINKGMGTDHSGF